VVVVVVVLDLLNGEEIDDEDEDDWGKDKGDWGTTRLGPSLPPLHHELF
jgi:hypothetical protein